MLSAPEFENLLHPVFQEAFGAAQRDMQSGYGTLGLGFRAGAAALLRVFGFALEEG